MKKFHYLLLISFMASSCAVGTYQPWAQNHFGAQTTVVLDKANFRVVRDVEAVVEVNNSDLKRQDVEKSAYAQLLKNARLTGSQVLVNVVVEEIRREKISLPIVKQYVAARATVIEFLKDNGEPVHSVNSSTSTNISKPINKETTSKQVTSVAAPTTQSKEPQVSQMGNTANQPVEQKKTVVDPRLQQLDEQYKHILQNNYLFQEFFRGYIDAFEILYQNPNEKNITSLERIQHYVNMVNNNGGMGYGAAKVGTRLRHAVTVEEVITILLEAADKYTKG